MRKGSPDAESTRVVKRFHSGEASVALRDEAVGSALHVVSSPFRTGSTPGCAPQRLRDGRPQSAGTGAYAAMLFSASMVNVDIRCFSPPLSRP